MNENIDTPTWTSDYGNDLPSDKESSTWPGDYVGGDKMSEEEPLTNAMRAKQKMKAQE